MMRAWIAVALLSSSWLFGLGYFYPAEPLIYLIFVAAGAVLLSGDTPRLPSGNASLVALLLLLPAVYFAPWPFRIMPLLIALGLTPHILLPPITSIKRLSQGAICAGLILAIQSLALTCYIVQTARSHELPKPFPELLSGIAGLFSIDAAANGSDIVMHSMRQVHRLGATWELLLDPVTFCFFIGGTAFLGLIVLSRTPKGQRWREWLSRLGIFTLIVALWLPARAGLLMAIYMHRVLRAEPARALYVMNHFFSPWSLTLLLAVPLFLIWRFLRVPEAQQSISPLLSIPMVDGDDKKFGRQRRGHNIMAIVLIFFAAALLTAATTWNPVGRRLSGRVKFVERHSTWEPTTRPYDTTWYGEISGYNYAAIYDYLGQYYQMSRLLEKDKIDEGTLEDCDVLVIKTPTTRYAPEEVKAVQRFVRRGGGLLLIGDHTNIMRTSTIMNDITRAMGFIFRDDLLFSNEESAYEQHFDLPFTPHPSLQYMLPMDFAVSCSIDPGFSHGRAVITSVGLWNMPPEYHHDNYHPWAAHCADMRYGAFVQLWAAWYGKGRAMAFTDSTIFSNFAVFQPGKAELMLGMIEWLNHANPPIDPRLWLALLGIASLSWPLVLVRRGSVPWLMLVSAAFCGWVLSAEAVAALHRWTMPRPKIQQPLVRVVIDRTTSTVPLSLGAYTQGDGAGYGLMEQWIARLGYYTIRQTGKNAFSGDALVSICPDQPVEPWFRDQLEHYIAEGGKLLVFDSPENVNSTANSLLRPFGLSIKHQETIKGTLSLKNNWPAINIARACEIVGGESVARVGERSVAAIAKHGKGSVMAVGCASLWNDKNMGDLAMWMVEPDQGRRLCYDTLYALVRLLVENKAIEPTQSDMSSAAKLLAPHVNDERSKPRPDLPELPLKELGPQE